MRIGNDLAPIATKVEPRNPDSPPADAFGALLAAAGIVVQSTPDASATSASPSGATSAATAGTATAGTAAPAVGATLTPASVFDLAAPPTAAADLAAAAPDGAFDMASHTITLIGSAPVTPTATTGIALGLQTATPATVDVAANASVVSADDPTAVDGVDQTVTSPTRDRFAAAPATVPPAPTASAPQERTTTITPVSGGPADGADPLTAPAAVPSPATDIADPADIGARVAALRTEAAAPTAPAAPNTASATDQPIAPSRFAGVAVAAARASAEANRPVRLSVRLDPPNLGEVRVELSARNGLVTVRVEPVSDAAGPLLSQQRNAVAEALERTGFSLASFDVRPGEQQQQQQQQQTRRAARVADLAAIDDAPTDPTNPGPTGLRI